MIKQVRGVWVWCSNTDQRELLVLRRVLFGLGIDEGVVADECLLRPSGFPEVARVAGVPLREQDLSAGDECLAESEVVEFGIQ